MRMRRKNPAVKPKINVRRLTVALAAAIGLIIFATTVYSFVKSKESDNLATGTNKGSIFDIFKGKPKDRINVLVMGADGGASRTDTIFVASFDNINNKLNIVSLPRDTRIKLAKERIDEIKRDKRYVPASGVMKLTEVHAYAGNKKAIEYTTKEVEKILGIKIDYYVKVDFEGFKKIIDTIGGVDFYVPQNMHYDDPTQKLFINLKQGQQRLNSNQAEQLVRFRHYKQGDLERINMQQTFIKTLINQIIDPKNIIKLPEMVMIAHKYVKTDISTGDMGMFVKFAQNLKGDQVQSYVIPGEPKYMNRVSYFIYDPYETQVLVDKVFFKGDGSSIKITKSQSNASLEDTDSESSGTNTKTNKQTKTTKATDNTKTTKQQTTTKNEDDVEVIDVENENATQTKTTKTTTTKDSENSQTKNTTDNTTKETSSDSKKPVEKNDTSSKETDTATKTTKTESETTKPAQENNTTTETKEAKETTSKAPTSGSDIQIDYTANN